MDRVSDERIIFYLEHQEAIEQWARLRAEATDEAHRFYCSLADPLAEVAAVLSPPAALCTHIGGSGWQRLMLKRRDWPLADCSRVLAGIGIEWSRKQAEFRGSKAAYVGLRVDIKHPDGVALRDVLESKMLDYRARNGMTAQAWWPLRRQVEPVQEDYWNDLEPLQRSIVDAVRQLWEDVHGIVDDAIRDVVTIESTIR